MILVARRNSVLEIDCIQPKIEVSRGISINI